MGTITAQYLLMLQCSGAFDRFYAYKCELMKEL